MVFGFGPLDPLSAELAEQLALGRPIGTASLIPNAPAYPLPGMPGPLAVRVRSGRHPFDYGQPRMPPAPATALGPMQTVPLPPMRPGEDDLYAPDPATIPGPVASGAGAAPARPPGFEFGPLPVPDVSETGSIASPRAGSLPPSIPSAVPAAEPMPDWMKAWKEIGDSGIGQTAMAMAGGLLSAPGALGWGQGFNNVLKSSQTRQLTDLTRYELGLKANKALREQQGENQTRKWLIERGVPEAEADAALAASAAGRTELLSNLFNNLTPKRDPYAAYQPNADGTLRAVPGGSADPAVIAAQTAARAEPQLVDVPQPDGTTRKVWLQRGATEGAAVGAAKLPSAEFREVETQDGSKRTLVRDPATGGWREMTVSGGGAGNPFATGRFNEGQGKAAGFADRMLGSEAIIRQHEGINRGPEGFIGGALAPITPNVFKSGNRQSYEQAKRDFINSQLRRESGAVISPEEFESAEKQYFPVPGNPAGVIEQKRLNRQRAIEAMGREGGPAYRPKRVFDAEGNITPYRPPNRMSGRPSREALEAEARRRGLLP